MPDAGSSSLERAISGYPSLSVVIPYGWLNQQGRAEPLACDHTLVWWLHHRDRADHLLTCLNTIVERLEAAAIPGTRRRLKRLWQNADGFRETLVELNFLAWLLERGFRFELPEPGADAIVELEGGDLSIEITALRRAIWFPRLYERLDVVATRMGFSGRMQYSREAPERLDADVARKIIKVALRDLHHVRAGGRKEHRRQYRDVGLVLDWQADDDPTFSVESADLGPAAKYGSRLVFNAVRNKSEQLSPNRPHCVVVDVGADEGHHVNAFVSRIGGEAGLIDWYGIPPHIKHVFIYWTSLDHIGPWSWRHLVNPNSDFSDVKGFEDFASTVFPDKCPIGVDFGWLDQAIAQALAEITDGSMQADEVDDQASAIDRDTRPDGALSQQS